MTGCGASDFHWGGYARLARLKAEWLVPRPCGITCQQAMGVGTAGFTAMLSVMTLEKHGLKPDAREILVTGAAIDSVGGQTLASVLRQLVYGASVTACGLAGGVEIPTTVLPFVLRGVSLLGIDAVQSKPETRRAVWSRIASDLPMSLIDSMSQVATLEDVLSLTPKILQGQVRGRTVIDVNR